MNPLLASQFLGNREASTNLMQLLGTLADRFKRPGALAMLEDLADLIPDGKEAEAAEALKQTLEGLTKWKAIVAPVVKAREEEARTLFEERR